MTEESLQDQFGTVVRVQVPALMLMEQSKDPR